jgi:quercetin dioxygenase-like cupin family protein
MLAHAQDGEIIPFDNVRWQPAGLPGAEMAMLWGNEADGTAMWAFRLQPGVAIPPHTHSKDYWGVAVQGRWEHIASDGQIVVTAQDAYVRIRAHDIHGDRCVGPEVCINLVQFSGPRDIQFPDVTPTKKP